MTTQFNGFDCCCGARTFNGVSSRSPESIVKDYILSSCEMRYHSETKRYIKGVTPRYQDAHLLFADPMRGSRAKYSGAKFAAYITKHKLGEITASPARHNPVHNERKKGYMDLKIYIWSPSTTGLNKWWKKNNPVPIEIKPDVGKLDENDIIK